MKMALQKQENFINNQQNLAGIKQKKVMSITRHGTGNIQEIFW